MSTIKSTSKTPEQSVVTAAGRGARVCAPRFFAAQRRSKRAGHALVAGAALALLAACNLIPPTQPDMTRFYVLTADAKTDGAPAAKPVRIALRPVDAPEFLRGQVMEVRVGENELRFVDDARWAEPLDAGITHVLRENLSRNPGLVLTARGDAHDFDVLVQIRQCEGVVAAHAARLAAHIEVYSADMDPKVVAQEEISTEVPGWDGKDYAQLAKKLSEALVRLSDRIPAALPAAK